MRFEPTRSMPTKCGYCAYATLAKKPAITSKYYAYEYGIPNYDLSYVNGRKMAFSQESIDRLYASIDTRSRAARLMADLGIYEAYPHHRPQGITDHKMPHRMLVHLTAFGGNNPSVQSPWFRHRVWLNTTDRVLEEQVVHGGIATRAGAGRPGVSSAATETWVKTIAMSEQICPMQQAAPK